MEKIPRKVCRLCVTETDFNVSLHSNYSRKTNMIDKILICLKIVIEETESVNTICYKCANSVEKYYDFITYIQKSQTKLANLGYERQRDIDESPTLVNRRYVTSYVREQADYTFSFLESAEEKKEPQQSSQFFSYFSPPNVVRNGKQSNENVWKTPKAVQKEDYKPPCKKSRQNSRDLFESQSQDVAEGEPRSLDWKLTPDENILKRVREKCFGRADF